MTTCAVGCGACCDPVILSRPLAWLTAWTADRWRSMPDPRNDDVWATWPEMPHMIGEEEEGKLRQFTIEIWDDCQAGGGRPNADFAAKHWTQLLGPETPGMVGGARVVCDAFDPHTRACTVHAEGGQPPICSDYPYYGMPPGDPGISYGPGMDPACSYNADVRTFLPIVAVR